MHMKTFHVWSIVVGGLVASQLWAQQTPEDRIAQGLIPKERLCKMLSAQRTQFQKYLAENRAQPTPLPATFQPVTTPRIYFTNDACEITVNVTGLDRIYLVAEGSMGGGHTLWGEPTLIDAQGNKTRLTEIPYIIGRVGWNEIRVKDGNQYWIHKKRMEYSIWAHVDSYIAYALDKKYTTFTAKVGIANTSGTPHAWACFSVLGQLNTKQADRLAEGLPGDPRLETLLPEWEALVSDGTLDRANWFRTPGSGVIVEAITNLLARCAKEEDLEKRLAELKAQKPEGGEPEWLLLYVDTLERSKKYAGFDQALEQLDATCAFVESEGANLAPLKNDLATVKQQAARVRSTSRDAMLAYEPTIVALRRRVLFAHPATNFRDLLVDVRQPPMYFHNVDQYLGRNSLPAPGLVVLEDWKAEKPGERWLTRDKLPKGSTQHPDLSYDAQRVIFSFCDHTETDLVKRRFLVYEATLDGRSIRRVTGTQRDPWDATRRDGHFTVMIEDFDPHYLPDGGFVFTSTRAQCIARCHAGRNAPSFLLHRGALDGTAVRALSWGEANEIDPAVLNDGRIIYNRWEYVNRHDCLFHKLWTTNPDGTGAANYYGNLTPFPQSLAEPRAIPNSSKVIATGTAHHSFTAGSIVLIDTQKGLEGPDPVFRLTPEAKFPEAEGDGWTTGTYVSPFPLTEKLFFAGWSAGPHFHQGYSVGNEESAARRKYNFHKLYLVFNYNNKAYRELIYTPPENYGCFSPQPIKPRELPPIRPTALNPAETNRTGAFYVQNVYESQHEIPAGSIKYLRINALFNQPTPRVPHRGWIMDEVAKGVIGTVPVNPDGSVAFTLPSRTPVQLQLLDENKMCVMNMRSFIYLQDGEHTSCVGCHDDRRKSPLAVNYSKAKPLTPTPIPGPRAETGFNYVATVQPVFDRYCIRCHGAEKTEGNVDLTGAYIERETERYPSGILRMSKSYAFFVTNPRFYTMMDRNHETVSSKPKDYLSHTSGLPEWLRTHGKAKGAELDPQSWQRVITWLDVNAQLYGNYSFNRNESRKPNPEGEKALREAIKAQFGEALSKQPFEALVNNGCIEESRILMAPLAAAAGGWGQLNTWTSTQDAGYQAMKAKVEAALIPLAEHDVHGTCGRPNACRCAACRVKEVEDTFPRPQ